MRVAFFQNGRILNVYEDIREIGQRDGYFIVRTNSGDLYKVWGEGLAAVEIPDGIYRKEE